MAALTDIGSVRKRNEDYILVRPDRRFAILADGLGGHRAGDVASRLAAKSLAGCIRRSALDNSMPTLVDIDQSFQTANRSVRKSARRHPERKGMGTTLVLTVFLERTLLYGYVGDSRLYRVREGRLEQLSRDHTLAQECIDSGTLTHRDRRYAAYNAMLSKSIGSSRRIRPDTGAVPLREGDVYLLCSDGLSDFVPAGEIENLLRPCKNRLLDSARDLVQIALAKGGHDNVSIILCRIAPGSRTG